MAQQQRPFVATDPSEWEVVQDEYEVVDDAPLPPADRQKLSWADELGLNTPDSSPMMGFLKGAGGAAVDMLQGAAAPTAQMIYGGGDLIRRGLGMERIIDKPYVQAAMDAPDTVAGKIGEYGPAVAGLGQLAANVGSKLLPNAARAGRNFQNVMGAARNIPINVEGPGNVALRIEELAQRGGSMPKAVRDFLNTKKSAMTYEVARDFASNISRLSVNEMGRLTPVMAREVANLRVALNQSVAEAAKQAGKLPEYKAAMREYAQAMKIRDAVDAAVKGAKKAALPAAGAAGAGYWLTRELKGLLGGGE